MDTKMMAILGVGVLLVAGLFLYTNAGATTPAEGTCTKTGEACGTIINGARNPTQNTCCTTLCNGATFKCECMSYNKQCTKNEECCSGKCSGYKCIV